MVTYDEALRIKAMQYGLSIAFLVIEQYRMVKIADALNNPKAIY